MSELERRILDWCSLSFLTALFPKCLFMTFLSIRGFSFYCLLFNTVFWRVSLLILKSFNYSLPSPERFAQHCPACLHHIKRHFQVLRLCLTLSGIYSVSRPFLRGPEPLLNWQGAGLAWSFAGGLVPGVGFVLAQRGQISSGSVVSLAGMRFCSVSSRHKCPAGWCSWVGRRRLLLGAAMSLLWGSGGSSILKSSFLVESEPQCSLPPLPLNHSHFLCSNLKGDAG